MTIQFQPYQDRAGEETRNRWAQSLDGIFEAYRQAKQNAQGQPLRDAQLQEAQQQIAQGQRQTAMSNLETGFDTLSPQFAGAQDRISAARIPAQPGTQAQPNPLFLQQLAGPLPGQDPREAAMNLMTEPTPGTPAQPESFNQLSHYDSAVKSFMDKRSAATDRGVRKDEAQISDINSQNLLRQSEAAYKDRMPNLQLAEHQGQLNPKRLTALGDALDPSKARAGAFGVSKQVFDRAERLQTLASAYQNNNLDSRQVEELAIGLNAMLSGSNVGAASQVEKLVPKSIIGNSQKLKEWITNDPQGTNQQEFVKRMLGSIDREKSTASDQLKRTKFERIGRYADLQKADPDGFSNVLNSAGVDPAEYSAWKKGGYTALTAVQGAEGAAPAGGNPSDMIRQMKSAGKSNDEIKAALKAQGH